MQLQIKPHKSNSYSLSGILIKSAGIDHWLQQLQKLDVNLSEIAMYAIPGTTANSLWGCFVSLPFNREKQKIMDELEFCQCIYNRLYIPQYASVYPLLNIEEGEKIFSAGQYVWHPEFGLVALESPIEWGNLLTLPGEALVSVAKPIATPFIPGKIKKLEIQPLPPEELLKAMEESIFPKKEKFEDKPLNWREKIKLSLLRTLFSSGKKENNITGKERTGLMKALEKLTNKIMPANSQWINKLEENLEELEKRSQTEMEKLMELFRNNPEEALKYAIPLDNDGTTRGGNMGSFTLNKRWNNFNLFGNTSQVRSSGTAMFGESSYQKLHQQYTQTAQALIKEKNYEKAAFVYMKLLKNNSMAAQTLEDGKLYPEAASVYLKYLQNRNKAAECYEKGQMTTDAIDLYKELKMNEKVGDLYITQHKQKEAFQFYQLVVDDYVGTHKHVKASLLYRNKMNDQNSAQELLLQGWRSDKDSFNCLNNYFQNIDDVKMLRQAIENIYREETNDHNKPVFLTALRYEHKKDEVLAERTKEIAYEVVAELVEKDPTIISELKNFNNDRSLVKDIMRYKIKRKN